MRIRKSWFLLLAAAAFAALSQGVHAQSADALIDKLVQKGILTAQEGKDLRQESNQNFSQAYAAKSGMPEWVNSLKFSGDIRLRTDSLMSNSEYEPVSGPSGPFIDRTRFRYRLRFGVTATLLDNLEAGFRLTSDDAANGGDGGGDPLSGNGTYKDNAAKKFVYIDLAYLRWYFLNGQAFSGSVTGGKMENPFLNSEMVWDPDYTPEGLAIQSAYRINNAHSLKSSLGAFVLDEFAASSNDPFLYGAQVRWEAVWNKKWSSALGASFYGIQNSSQLTNVVYNPVPNQNSGNTRLPGGRLAYDFNPIVADASVTYTLNSFPLYPGRFPIRVGGEYMNNPAAPENADNYAWNVRAVLGKSGKRGTWEINYAYRWVGANSWWEEVVDNDFVGFYARAWVPTASGYGNPAGPSGGTNVKGYTMRLAYSPSDALLLSVRWNCAWLVDPYPSGSDSRMNRLLVDASVKF